MTATVDFFLNGTEIGGDKPVMKNKGDLVMYCQGTPV